LVKRQARLWRDVLPHRARLKITIRLDFDEIADRDEANQLVSFYHGHAAEPCVVILDIMARDLIDNVAAYVFEAEYVSAGLA
jgi:hypothetical protein